MPISSYKDVTDTNKAGLKHCRALFITCIIIYKKKCTSENMKKATFTSSSKFNILPHLPLEENYFFPKPEVINLLTTMPSCITSMIGQS